MLAQTITEKKLLYPNWSSPKKVVIADKIRYALWLRSQSGGTTKNNVVRHAGCKHCPHGQLRHMHSHATKKDRCTVPGCLCMELETIIR